MRELVDYVATSLDGKIAAPDGGFDAFSTEGDHMEWIFRQYRDTLPAPALTALGLEPDGRRFGTVVMGWNTYAVGLPVGLDNPYPHLNYAASPTLTRVVLIQRDQERRCRHRAGSVTPRRPRCLALRRGRAGLAPRRRDRPVGAEGRARRPRRRPAAVRRPVRPHAFDLVRSTPFASGVVVHEYRR